jgi:hypothetical protein
MPGKNVPSLSAVGDRADAAGQAAAAPPADPGETVQVPRQMLEQMQQRLQTLEQRQDERREAFLRSSQVLDMDFEDFKAKASRPASVRTQEAVDKKYGTAAPRFRVRLDSSDPQTGKPGPNVSEHFELQISALSDLEAKQKYLDAMGITKTEWRVVVEPVAA